MIFVHLPNDHQKADIVCFPRYKYSLNVGEWKMYADCAKVPVGRIICEFLPNSSGSSQCYLPTFLTGAVKK